VALPIFDSNNWTFEFGWIHPNDRDEDGRCYTEKVTYTNAKDILIDIEHGERSDNEVQNKVQRQLNENDDLRVWERSQTKIQDAPNFEKYRGAKYDDYHQAARNLVNAVGTSEDHELAEGLISEINMSQTILPAGQVLFHGRADKELSNGNRYPAFVSTSLDPIVALNSAKRRASAGGTRTVYILKTSGELKALWGQAGDSFEFELLLPVGLMVEETGVTKSDGGDLKVVEANIVDQNDLW
jgi:hypothetical protein